MHHDHGQQNTFIITFKSIIDLSTYDFSFSCIESSVTHRTPNIVDADFNSSFNWINTAIIDQPHCSINTLTNERVHNTRIWEIKRQPIQVYRYIWFTFAVVVCLFNSIVTDGIFANIALGTESGSAVM
jgi:hypothetical protein